MTIYDEITKFLIEDEYEQKCFHESKFICECGKTIKKNSKYYHLKSSLHKKNLKNLHKANHPVQVAY